MEIMEFEIAWKFCKKSNFETDRGIIHLKIWNANGIFIFYVAESKDATNWLKKY